MRKLTALILLTGSLIAAGGTGRAHSPTRLRPGRDTHSPTKVRTIEGMLRERQDHSPNAAPQTACPAVHLTPLAVEEIQLPPLRRF